MPELPPELSARPAPEPPGPAAAPTLREWFIGPQGLRAGWSLLLAYVLFNAMLYACGFLMSAINPPRPGAQVSSSGATLIRPYVMFTNEGLVFLCLVLTTWVMARIERRPLAVYGIGFSGSRRWLSNLLGGLGWGVVFLSMLVLALRASGLLVFDARILFGREALGYAFTWVAGFMLVGLLEEYSYRGFLQFTLTRGLSSIYAWAFELGFGSGNANACGFWTAAFGISFYFGFNHTSNPGESPVGLLSAALAGLVFCFSLWRTGSLWWAIGFHCTWDWAQSFLYGVADSGIMVQGHLFATHPVGPPILSGGLTGPEGSLFLLPVLALTIVVIRVTLPSTHTGYTSVQPPSGVPALDSP